MSGTSDWLRFAVSVLATWRLTYLLSREDGPADVLVRLRKRLGTRFAGRLLDCFYCLSMWVALPVALLLTREPVDAALVWLALSGAACLLERAVQEPVVIQTFTSEEEDHADDGMLWAEKGKDEEDTGTADRDDASRHPAAPR